jgi:hypothetical protein
MHWLSLTRRSAAAAGACLITMLAAISRNPICLPLVPHAFLRPFMVLQSLYSHRGFYIVQLFFHFCSIYIFFGFGGGGIFFVKIACTGFVRLVLSLKEWDRWQKNSTFYLLFILQLPSKMRIISIFSSPFVIPFPLETTKWGLPLET